MMKDNKILLDEIVGKVFPQYCGDSLRVIRKTEEKHYSNYLFECEFLNYPYKVKAIKYNIKEGKVLNPQIEIEEFVKKIWPQHCGDSLRIIRKTEEKQVNSNGKLGATLFEAEFIKYPCRVKKTKGEIKNGNVINPLIEKEEEKEFINKIWPQSCGENLKVLKKTKEKDNNKNFLFECEFQKYPCKIKAIKRDIKSGNILNPRIEEEEFIKKEWPQRCGDTLKILKKTKEKILFLNGEEGNNILFEAEFQKYPYKIKATKNDIKKGKIYNPQIEINEFMSKNWLQNCGDILKIIRKTEEKNKDGKFLFECQFQKYPCIIKATKSNIKLGRVDNPAFPWKSKEKLQKYIQENFKGNKPTLLELSKIFNIVTSTIGQAIIKFNLRDLIDYSYSGQENDLKEFIQLIYEEEIITYNGKKEDNYQEIDIYLPKKNFGVEFDGNYWHSNLYKTSNYHQEKSLYFKDKGIQLIHIFEFEWLNKREICESLIKTKFGIFDKIIGARQCKIKEIKNYKEYANFCNENHLQGEAGAKVKLGLYYNDELVQVMSFGSPRFSNKYEWEIIRECSKLGYCIIGGKKRLWNYFIQKYNPNSVVSYCDYSKFNGNSYLDIGFKFKQLNKPGFWWYDEKTNEVYWRDPYHHKEMKEKGYLQIYDCGQLVFEWFKE